jgi:hypothetical protein
MWSWLRKTLGITNRAPDDSSQRKGWLRRLLAYAGVTDAFQADSGIQAAPKLMENKVFFIRRGGVGALTFSGNIGGGDLPGNLDIQIHTE